MFYPCINSERLIGLDRVGVLTTTGWQTKAGERYVLLNCVRDDKRKPELVCDEQGNPLLFFSQEAANRARVGQPEASEPFDVWKRMYALFTGSCMTSTRHVVAPMSDEEYEDYLVEKAEERERSRYE